MVPKVGVEPTRHWRHQILSLTCISQFHHLGSWSVGRILFYAVICLCVLPQSAWPLTVYLDSHPPRVSWPFSASLPQRLDHMIIIARFGVTEQSKITWLTLNKPQFSSKAWFYGKILEIFAVPAHRSQPQWRSNSRPVSSWLVWPIDVQQWSVMNPQLSVSRQSFYPLMPDSPISI